MPWYRCHINQRVTFMVGGLEHVLLFHLVGNNHPNWLKPILRTIYLKIILYRTIIYWQTYFSEGFFNHQPASVCPPTAMIFRSSAGRQRREIGTAPWHSWDIWPAFEIIGYYMWWDQLCDTTRNYSTLCFYCRTFQILVRDDMFFCWAEVSISITSPSDLRARGDLQGAGWFLMTSFRTSCWISVLRIF